MFQALFYKEWVKTRRIIILIGAIFAGIIIYSFINTGQTFRIGGSVQAWADIILKDAPVFPSIIQWLPLLTALLLAFAQFVPEMTNKRLKLSLHLPMPETKIISTMLCYGLVILVIIYLITYIILITGLSFYYPQEIRILAFWKSLPWFIAGLTGYLLATWICLEPVWSQRIYNAFISICILALFFIRAQSGAYLPLLYVLAIIVIIGFGLPFYSATRFKEGKQ